jgi:hypothetical protein
MNMWDSIQNMNILATCKNYDGESRYIWYMWFDKCIGDKHFSLTRKKEVLTHV